MFKRIAVAVLLAVTLAVTANAQVGNVLNVAFEAITLTTEFGIGVPMNDDLFQTDYKESIYGAQRVEAYLYRGVSVYGSYSSETFDPVAGAEGIEPIDASVWGLGVMVQAELNETGSVLGYLELGASKSLSETESSEWEWQKGIAARCYLTSSHRTAIDLGVRYKTLGDTPQIESFLPRIAFCVTPGK